MPNIGQQVFTRRSLPHWYVPGADYFITFRLDGSLPREALDKLAEQRRNLMDESPRSDESPRDRSMRIHKLIFAGYDRLLDERSNDQLLSDPRIAAVVRSSLYYVHEELKRYHPMSYRIMPNHVHLVFSLSDQSFQPNEVVNPGEQTDSTSPLSRVMHSIKSFTAHEINKLTHSTGPVWQRESFDHWIRTDEELERIVEYVRMNPVKARLVQKPEDWYFSSAHDRLLSDGQRTGWLKWRTKS